MFMLINIHIYCLYTLCFQVKKKYLARGEVGRGNYIKIKRFNIHMLCSILTLLPQVASGQEYQGSSFGWIHTMYQLTSPDAA